MRIGFVLLFSVAVGTLLADAPKESPVGLILAPGGARLLRASSETPLAAKSGDILFSGDVLRSGTAPASFLYCPAKASQTLEANGEVLLDTAQMKVKSGKLAPPKPVNACFLPQVVRVAIASQQHYGVSMTRGLAKPEGEELSLDALPPDVRAQIAPLDLQIKANPDDTPAWLAEAAVYESKKLEPNALAAYRKVAVQWKDAVWVRGKIFELEESLAVQAALKAAEISPDAKTYALLVGISEYQKLPQDLWLHYAHTDANSFAQHLRSGRGGGVPQDQMLLLTDKLATTAAIRNGFQTFLKNRAGKKDTVFIFLAGHGTVDSRGAYILTHDSDPQDLSSTAIPMAEIQALVAAELGQVGRVVLLADVCRAATIGSLKTASLSNAVAALGEASGEMLGLMAARPKEVSREGPEYGGGHGAFTYAALKGLQGMADKDDDRFVSAGELIDYVVDNVRKLTQDKQHARDFGNMENATKLADLSKPGIELARYPVMYDSRRGGPVFLAQAQQAAPLSQQAQQDVDAFQAAIRARRLLPDEQGSPWPILDRLRTQLSPQQMFLQENYLRVALEDQAQQVLLRYLAGDQSPQTKLEFDSGSKYMEAAMRLTPESLYLEGRDSFFKGRALLFDKRFTNAQDFLEQSVRIDPGEAYGYNALGIAYLEQADFAKAIPAFRDAVKRAPNWSYPLHNLALAYQEAGDYQATIRSYQLAMKITPQFAYLPYNLGLVYQRLNQRREAEASYKKAIELAPDSGEPLNAMGSLKAAEGRNAEAERLYKQALLKSPNLLAARHNLAILLSGLKDRQQEAIDLWKLNLSTQPDFLASRLSLAEYYARKGESTLAIEEYVKVVAAKPEYVAARVALAGQYAKGQQWEAVLEQLRQAVKSDSQNASLFEQIGDAEKAGNNPTAAKEAYSNAMQLELEKSERNRIRKKLNF